MLVQCDQCNAKYKITIKKNPGKTVTFKCGKCANLIKIAPDHIQAEESASPPAMAAPVPAAIPASVPAPPNKAQTVKVNCLKCGNPFIRPADQKDVICYQCRIDTIVKKVKDKYGVEPPPPEAETSSRYTIRTSDGLILGPIRLRTVAVLAREKRIKGVEEVSKDNSPYIPLMKYPELAEFFPELKEIMDTTGLEDKVEEAFMAAFGEDVDEQEPPAPPPAEAEAAPPPPSPEPPADDQMETSPEETGPGEALEEPSVEATPPTPAAASEEALPEPGPEETAPESPPTEEKPAEEEPAIPPPEEAEAPAEETPAEETRDEEASGEEERGSEAMSPEAEPETLEQADAGEAAAPEPPPSAPEAPLPEGEVTESTLAQSVLEETPLEAGPPGPEAEPAAEEAQPAEEAGLEPEPEIDAASSPESLPDETSPEPAALEEPLAEPEDVTALPGPEDEDHEDDVITWGGTSKTKQEEAAEPEPETPTVDVEISAEPQFEMAEPEEKEEEIEEYTIESSGRGLGEYEKYLNKEPAAKEDGGVQAASLEEEMPEEAAAGAEPSPPAAEPEPAVEESAPAEHAADAPQPDVDVGAEWSGDDEGEEEEEEVIEGLEPLAEPSPDTRYKIRYPDGLILGPVKLETIKELFETGNLTGLEEVEREGEPWAGFSELPELAELVAEEEPGEDGVIELTDVLEDPS